MKIALSTISLALGLAVYSVPAFAQSSNEAQVTKTTQETVGPAQVMDSWMQPTVVRTTKKVDAEGTATVDQAPIIQERHERVMIPETKSETTTVVNQQPKVVKTTAVVDNRSYRSNRRVANVCHKPAHRRYTAAAHRTVALQTTTQPTQTTVEQRQTTQDTSVILERKDPALESN